MLEKQVKDLTDRRFLSLQNSSLFVPYITKSTNHPDPKKFNRDKIKLGVFLTQLNLKLKLNLDYFIRESQDTKQNKLSYAISRFREARRAKIEPYISVNKINFESITQFKNVLNIRFKEVNQLKTAKYQLYHLYQINKELEVFLNTFLRLQKKAKIDNSQVLDMSNKKLSNEFKDCLVTINKTENFQDLITSLWDIDVNVKQITKELSLCAKPVMPVIYTAKLLFKILSSVSAKSLISVGVTATGFGPGTITGTYPDFMDVSNVGQRDPIFQAEKDHCNSLGLCRQYGKVDYITIDHRNLVLLASKR